MCFLLLMVWSGKIPQKVSREPDNETEPTMQISGKRIYKGFENNQAGHSGGSWIANGPGLPHIRVGHSGMIQCSRQKQLWKCQPRKTTPLVRG